MKDSVILGSGNSRYLKSVADFKTLYPTYDDFVAALVAGTLPIDLNGINAAGFQQLGDALGKATLLKDATAALYGLEDTAVPDDVFSALSKAVTKKVIIEHTWAAGSTTLVFVDLTTIDFTKRIIVEMDCGENYNSQFRVGFYKDKKNTIAGNLYCTDMINFTKTTANAWPMASFLVYGNNSARFELLNTGLTNSDGRLRTLQFDAKYYSSFYRYIIESNTAGIQYMAISPAGTRSEASFKVYELS